MILTCEKCKTRYLLPSHSLAPDGRRVRCKVCDHEWFQEYDDGDYTEEHEDSEDDLDAIPDSVKPIPEGSNVPAVEGRDDSERFPAGAVLASAAVFGLIFGLLISFAKPITQIWPQSGVFYELIGKGPALPGEGLIFDQLRGTSDNTENGGLLIELSGNIVNLSSDAVSLPPVRFVLNDAAGEKLETWYLSPAETSIGAHEEMPFQTFYQTDSNDAQGVTISFMVDDVPVADSAEVAIDEAVEESDDSVEGQVADEDVPVPAADESPDGADEQNE